MSQVPFLENACCNDSTNRLLLKPMTYFAEEDNNIMVYLQAANQLSTVIQDIKVLSTAPLLYHPGITRVQFPEIPVGFLEEVLYETIIHYCRLDTLAPIPAEFHVILTEKPDGYNSEWSLIDKIGFLKRNGKQFSVEQLEQVMMIVNGKNRIQTEKPLAFTQVDVLKEIVERFDTTDSDIIAAPLRRLLATVLDSYNPSVMVENESVDLNRLKHYLNQSNNELYSAIIDFFRRYGNLSDRDYNRVHDFIMNINAWTIQSDDKDLQKDLQMDLQKDLQKDLKIDKPDSTLSTSLQFIKTIIHQLTKVYPTAIMNGSSFYKEVPKHWELTPAHVSDIEHFIQKYYSTIIQFQSDPILFNLLNEVSTKLVDLNTFVQHVPLFPEITKQVIDEETGEPMTKTYFSLFDKQTIHLLFAYCFYSCIYEFITSSDDPELLRTDLETAKMARRQQIRSSQNPANSLVSMAPDADAGLQDADTDLHEVFINTGNQRELKDRVAALLFVLLDIERENKETINVSYEQVMKQVSRSKEKEKHGIIKKLGQLSIEERKVENMLKNFRIGRWNVGQQKGLFQYDGKTYDRERDELLNQILEESGSGGLDMVSEELLDIYDLDRLDEEADETEIANEMFDIDGLGENFMDGAYYEEDQEQDD
jgi:hypothetical protein